VRGGKRKREEEGRIKLYQKTPKNPLTSLYTSVERQTDTDREKGSVKSSVKACPCKNSVIDTLRAS
jgi:hypothetical protein